MWKPPADEMAPVVGLAVLFKEDGRTDCGMGSVRERLSS
jgi:hypothetical protein